MIKSLKIISGGQTGVDRAAMDFALENNIPCSGWCPKGRRAEDGIIPLSYPLRETKESRYRERTIKNVEESQGLLVFVDGKPDKGTVLAIDQAEKRNIPTYIIYLTMNVEDQETGILSLLENSDISVINIVGPRESNNPGIYNKTKAFLEELFPRLNVATSSK
ncbi:MAG TPA: molybdenum cofactor carrier [Bacteroidetes bacterium]|nr:molybdenum cofactor carrier [Bacteroidota bacterium]